MKRKRLSKRKSAPRPQRQISVRSELREEPDTHRIAMAIIELAKQQAQREGRAEAGLPAIAPPKPPIEAIQPCNCDCRCCEARAKISGMCISLDAWNAFHGTNTF